MKDKKEKLFLHKKKKNESIEYEDKELDRERKIAIFRNNSLLIIDIKNISDLFFIVENLNMPYFYSNREKLYFHFDKNLDYFWSKKENKILYESKTEYIISSDTFSAFHENHKPENMKYYSDFCFPYYYFSDEEKEQFVNNLDKEVINKLKDTRYFDDFKIIKFYRTKKNGKSTIVYYYFGMRRYIPLNEMNYIDDINNMNEFDKKDPKYIKEYIHESGNNKNDILDEILNETLLEIKSEKEKNNKYFIKKIYNKNFKRIEDLEADSENPLFNDEDIEELNIFSKKNKIDSNHDEEEEIKKYSLKIFQKEFYFTENDTIGFFRSCYLNQAFLKGKKSEDLKITTLQLEFSGLFKSYRVYKFFINKFNDFYDSTKDIIDISEFIIKFMNKYKTNKRRYFIILDGITKDLFEKLTNLEKIGREANKCFIIEIFDNEGINEKIEKEVIDGKNKDDELIIYNENYSEFSDNFNLSEEEKKFLFDNFKKNLYYYKRYMKWKNEKKFQNRETFLEEINKEIQSELLKGFTCPEEGQIFYRYIFMDVLNKKIMNKNILKKLNFNHFFIAKEKEKDKLKLRALPFIEKIIKNLAASDLRTIIKEDYFISLDEYIKGGIFEDIIKKEIKKIFYNRATNKKDFQELDIKRLVDNKIYSFYNKGIIKKILNQKKSFMSLKAKLKTQNFRLKNKITVLYCVQNAKHYDLGVLFYNTLLVFQITINKSNINIDELLNFLELDLWYTRNKLEFLTDEENLIEKIYVYFINMDFESIYQQNDTKEIKSYISKNKIKNEKMKNALKNTNIQIIYCSKNCELLDCNSNKIICLPTENDIDIYPDVQNSSLVYKMDQNIKKNKILDLMKHSINLPEYIKKDSIEFFSFFYPKINMPPNFILYIEISDLEISIFKINKNYYDLDFNKLSLNIDVEKPTSNPRLIMIYSYDLYN